MSFLGAIPFRYINYNWDEIESSCPAAHDNWMIDKAKEAQNQREKTRFMCGNKSIKMKTHHETDGLWNRERERRK